MPLGVKRLATHRAGRAPGSNHQSRAADERVGHGRRDADPEKVGTAGVVVGDLVVVILLASRLAGLKLPSRSPWGEAGH
jgi:hypothetical protein